ncbi:hypothetical protein CCGE531_27590 (plasmid) [Rhizobium sp. CCGE531]|nr:hypothetical protein CCGE531_27590 [Rhizobium sp. CCGE531]AYG76234.1 hypothetical protein CCGE532_27080 [Rhizobium sp. CCGE532]
MRLNDKDQAACKDARSSHITVTPADFKLREWAKQLEVSSGKPDAFSYTVDVVITTTASLGSDLANGHFSGTLGTDGMRQTTRTVEFNFAELVDKRPTEVYVTNFPAKSFVLPSEGGKPFHGELKEILPQGSVIVPTSPSRKLRPELDIEKAIEQNRQQRGQNRIDDIRRGLDF